MKIPRWFGRSFPESPSPDHLPFIVERLRGTPARAQERTAGLAHDILTSRPDGAWSIQEHIGHLGDLEPLWLGRVDDLLDGKPELRPADLTNRTTHEADHNRANLPRLIGHFRSERQRLVERLDVMSDSDAVRTALHPRLKQPMRLIDLCQFVADHDDHHLALVTEILRKAIV